MNVNEITQLMECFDKSKATKLQVKSGDTELLLESMPTSGQVAVQEVKQDTETVRVASNEPATQKKMKREPVTEGIKGTPVKAPLIGTFYCAPAPDEKPFVEVGQSVKQGDVVGIIEAMKLMNEITAPADGVVKSILAENGNMVEYGEVLMVLE